MDFNYYKLFFHFLPGQSLEASIKASLESLKFFLAKGTSKMIEVKYKPKWSIEHEKIGFKENSFLDARDGLCFSFTCSRVCGRYFG